MLHQQESAYVYTHQAPLLRLCAQAQAEGRFALDLEFGSANSPMCHVWH